MLEKEESKGRKRMVVEEVEVASAKDSGEVSEAKEIKPEILDDGIKVSSQEVASGEVIKPIEKEEPAVPLHEEPKKSKSPIFWIIVPGIFLLGALLGGIVFYQKGVNKNQNATPSPMPTTNVVVGTPVASASPSAALDLTKYTINILNGSGTAGEASKAKTLLTTAGFKVGTTGNAATYDFTKTIIKAKSTVEAAYLTELSKALGKTYVVGESETLTTGSVDVQVIIGSSKAQ